MAGIHKETITPDESNSEGARQPEPKKRSVNVLLILIVACWLLFLYVFGGVKGPG